MLESKQVITEQVEVDFYRCHEEDDQGEMFEKGLVMLSLGGKALRQREQPLWWPGGRKGCSEGQQGGQCGAVWWTSEQRKEAIVEKSADPVPKGPGGHAQRICLI